MKNYFLLLFIIVSSPLFAQWEYVNSPNIGADNYSFIEFINDDIGFIGVDNTDLVYRTTDAGNSWSTYNYSQLPIEISNSTKVEKISFVTDSIGYLYSSSTSTNQGSLYKSINQGEDWELIKVITGSGIGGTSKAFDFVNIDYGVVLFRNQIYTTKNGGESWDSTLIPLPLVAKIKVTVYDTSRVRLYATGYNSADWSDTTLYSANFCDSFSGINGPHIRNTAYTDSLSFGSYEGVSKSYDYGLSWENLINVDELLFSPSYLFCYSKDTIFMRDNHSIYRSDDSGNTWGKNVSFYFEQSFFSNISNAIEFSKGTNYLYFLVENVGLFRTSNLGGNTLPILNLGNTSLNICSEDTFIFNNTNDSSYNYHWIFDGEIIDTTYNLNYVFPSYEGHFFNYLHLVVSDGEIQYSDSIYAHIYPPSIPEEFTADIDSRANCDGTYNLKISPVFYASYNTYNMSHYEFFDGTEYHDLDQFSKYIENDTLIFEISIPINSLESVRCNSSTCGGGYTDASVNQPSLIYDFDLYPLTMDNNNYCMYDTIRVKIPNSDPQATYNISGGYSPVSFGNGDTLEVTRYSLVGFNSISGNFSYTIEYNKGGCYKTKEVSVYIEQPITFFDFIPNNTYDPIVPYNSYNLGDTVYFDHREDNLNLDCFWSIESESIDTSFHLCDDHFFVPESFGDFSVTLKNTSLIGCIDHIQHNFMVTFDDQPIFPNLNCEFDSAFLAYGNLNTYQILDIHEDRLGNFHVAGNAGYNNGWEYRHILRYAKYDSDKNLLLEDIVVENQVSSPVKGNYNTSVITDDNLNTYVGVFQVSEYPKYPTLPFPSNIETNFQYRLYAYLIQRDSAYNLTNAIFFAPDNPLSSYSSGMTAINDLVYLDGKVYGVLESTVDGTIQQYNLDDNVWEDSSLGYNIGFSLIRLDTNGVIEDVSLITKYKNGRWNGTDYNLNIGIGTSKNISLSIDEQDRLKIYYTVNNGYGPVNFGTYEVLPSKPYSWVSILGTYDVDNGYLWADMVSKGLIFEDERRYNNVESDVYGNSYIITNVRDLYQSNTNYCIVKNDTIQSLSAAISKIDANSNSLWNISFKNCEILDLRMTGDEQHIGVLIDPEGNGLFEGENFHFGMNTASMYEVLTQENSAIFMQFSHTGVLEKLYEYGNGIKEVTGQFLHFDHEGFFKLNSKISNSDTTFLVMNGDTIFNQSLLTFKIDGEFGQCDGLAYPGRLSDTLFLHPQNIDLCADTTFFLPWIATDTIVNVNLGYYLNESEIKIFIEDNTPASDYGFLWDVPIFENLDSIKFFIESITPEFYHETSYYTFNGNRDIVALQDTLICEGSLLEILPLDSFDLFWSPIEYFENPEQNTGQNVLIQNDFTVFIEGKTALNKCLNHDTIHISVINLPIANFNSYVLPESLSLVNSSLNYENFEWNITNNQPIFDQDSLVVNYTVPIFNSCIIANNICSSDTSCALIDVAYSIHDTISICLNDSIYLQNSWQNSEGVYIDSLSSIFEVDSIVFSTLIINQDTYGTDSISICLGDSIYLGGEYHYTEGIYMDSLINMNGCDSLHQTIVEIIDFPIASFDFYVFSESLSLVNTSMNSESIKWNITDNLPIIDQDSVVLNFTVPTFNSCIIATNFCSSDTVCNNISVNFSVQDSILICEGDSIFLQNSWQNNEGNYIDTLSSVFAVDSIVLTTLSLNLTPISFDTLSICQGDSIYLSGEYQNSSGIYSEIFPNIDGCDSIHQTTLVVNLLPIVTLNPFDPDTICTVDDAVILPVGYPEGGIYSGNSNGQGFFETSLFESGTYEIYYSYTDEHSCLGADTTTITIELCTMLEEYNNEFDLLVYPNPTQNRITIEKPFGFNKKIDVTIFDPNNKIIIKKIISKNEGFTTNIDISKFSNGVYLLKLIVDGKIYYKSIIKL